jgi:hypothetical protein
LNIPRDYAFGIKGAREVRIGSTGYENQCIRVILCITTDDHKLSPYIILSRKTLHKTDMFPEDVIVDAKNGCMTADLLEDWMENVRRRCLGALSNHQV